MQDILGSHGVSAHDGLQELSDIICEEERLCAERIEARIRPILVKEFRRVAKRYRVEKIIFGNGTCAVVWDGDRALADNYDGVAQFPKGLRRLVSLCDAVASRYPVDDITKEDLK
jgi:hypothetical protein